MNDKVVGMDGKGIQQGGTTSELLDALKAQRCEDK